MPKEKISDWSGVPEDMQTAVASVFSLGLITGVGGGKFDGDAAMSRAQAAVVYCRLADALSAPGQDPANPGQQEPAEPDEQEPEQAPNGPTLANGKAITDDNIREIIYGLQDEYPEGRPWTNDNYYLCEVMRIRGFGCEGFALICSDAVFGQLPLTETHSDFSRVRVGDLLRINHDTHTVVVLEVRESSVIVTEGNYNSSIHWGREITRQSLEDGAFTVRTRYPVQSP